MSGSGKIKVRVVEHLPTMFGEPRSRAILERLKVVQNYAQVADEFHLSRQRVHQIANHYGYRTYKVVRWQEAEEQVAPLLEQLRHPKPCLHCANETPRSKPGALCSDCMERFRAIGMIRYHLKKYQSLPGRNRFHATQARSLIKRYNVRPEEI
jgi:hypothetical protein